MAHITRFEAPWFLNLSKKEYKWTIRANPGPHKLSESIPLALLLKHYLNVAETTREAKRLVVEGKIMVDGRVRKDYKFPVGLMDVISIPSSDLYFRIVPDNIKYLMPVKISKEDAKYKFVRIVNKTTNKNGNIQLNLEDGRNILIPKEKVPEMNYPTLTTLKIEIPSQSIIKSYELSEGKYAIIIGGRNVGLHGVIKTIQYAKYKKRKYSIVTIEQKNGESVQTNLQNVMVIGDSEIDPNVGVR
ncbi:30S ribosomal protein S4e [Sulfurisphaera ohwakuensis]|uniref:Small ribosomal subunit protein eS4 n=1 Tax=Sulfurisphaera ohwakuensis TaxID=69656 RepID=A0A650CE07_SULOH|nr:30S ribosomal protein S4e [Sulfurisphaera ohwakuensis]MBB5253003.1 small subunit ribosomal protein S4e [Sulfurisphaera ohwakuensis]QGR16071.1 30S ribosomal protein S4e [Sulfurisphaera ohwakuensis]